MKAEAVDTNCLILPSQKEERKKFLGLNTRKKENKRKQEVLKEKRYRKKKKQLHAKKEANETRAFVINELKKYSLSQEVAMKLQATSSCCRRDRSLKKRKVSQTVKCPERMEGDAETTEASSDDDESTSSSVCESVPISPIPVEPLDKVEQPMETPSEKVYRRDDAFLRQHIHLQRTLDVEKQRSLLPAIALEQEIIETIIDNDIVLLTGSTGCGKSTQVPQFLYEAGFCGGTQQRLIGITQPRRVAVTFLVTRVEHEMNRPGLCGYQIRHEANLPENVCLKFMTDGVLLREMQGDFLCSRYSVIVLDEAHERSVNCDVLLGLLSRAVLLRRDRFNKQVGDLGPLRLVVMSATLAVEDLLDNRKLFPIPPPVLDIPSHTHPVTLHFSRRTADNYIESTAAKTVDIHRKLPAGSILVFMPGRREVHAVITRIAERLRHRDSDGDLVQDTMAKDSSVDQVCLYDESDGDLHSEDALCGEPTTFTYFGEETQDTTKPIEDKHIMRNLGLDPTHIHFTLQDDETEPNEAVPKGDTCSQHTRTLDQGNQSQNDATQFTDIEAAAALGFDSGSGMGSVNPKGIEKASVQWVGYGCEKRDVPRCSVRLVPLYALLPLKDQEKAFTVPSANERVIIVATNVAETSLTLPNIRYVVDSGKEKKMQATDTNSASMFCVQWISKASANQRAGRAGRVGPGHCYRLYSSAVYTNIFADYPVVSLLNTPLDAVLLFMGSIGIRDLNRFPFPSPPSPSAVQRAKNLLVHLNALEDTPKNDLTLNITPLGILMAQLPVSPRFAVALVSAVSCARQDSGVAQLIPMCCGVCAGWTVGHLLSDDAFQNDKNTSHVGWRQFQSDALVTWWMVSHYILSCNKDQFVKRFFGKSRQLMEAASLYRQLLGEIQRKLKLDVPFETWKRNPPVSCSARLVTLLHDSLLLGFLDNVTVKTTLIYGPQSSSQQPRHGYVGGECLWPLESGDQHGSGKVISIPKTSVVYHLRPRPDLLCFSRVVTVVEANKRDVKSTPEYCFPVCASSLARLRSPLIHHSGIIAFPPPMYDPDQDRIVGFVKTIYTPLSYTLRATCMPLSEEDEVSYRVFAQALLQGDVVPLLKQLHNQHQSYLRIQPRFLNHYGSSRTTTTTTINVQTAQLLVLPPLDSDLQKLLDELMKAKCSSRSKLQTIWSRNRHYLKEEYMGLVSLTCPQRVLNHVVSRWGSGLFHDSQ